MNYEIKTLLEVSRPAINYDNWARKRERQRDRKSDCFICEREDTCEIFVTFLSFRFSFCLCLLL